MDLFELTDTTGRCGIACNLEDAQAKARRWHTSIGPSGKRRSLGRITWEFQAYGVWYGYRLPASRANPEEGPIYVIKQRART